MSTIKELLQALNNVRARKGEQPLKSWKQSAAKLEERLRKERHDIVAGSAQTAINEEADTPVGQAADVKSLEQTPEPKVRKSKDGGPSIAEVVRPLLLTTEMTNREIFDHIQDKHPGLLDEKRKWYTAWYRGDLRRKGKLPPKDA